MRSAPNPTKTRIAYGRCRIRPVVGSARSRPVIRFEIESDERIIAVTAGIEDRPPLEVQAWIERITSAPVLSVRGIFRPRHGLAALQGYKAWRIHATEIRIPEPDNGRPGIRAARAFAQDHEGQERRPDPPLREIVLTDLVPVPMRPHNGAYALAYNASLKGQPIALIHPIIDEITGTGIEALSQSLARATQVVARGYFRPEVIRSDQVVAWGFIAHQIRVG